ncbi:hypothetical protein [Rariglobus hedericola]|uniref:Uncharacterized protein n=1 Tax=Rariglobus hedericola TaxID=2597822 RepID=A0A556QQD1_9BACT|nr:hypothetical protein [Rariglobus hedericola]TSJ78839.1 hypothetical protein FPL22_05905 [Rariglobus hedericola]
MKPLACLALLGVITSLVVAPAIAQPTPPAAPAPVEVLDVKFNSVRINSGTWYETEVQVQPRGGVAADNRQFVNRVKVTLSVGVFSVKAPAGSKIPDTYYRASAEAVAVEANGGRTLYRFYLPPEIVKRDQITGDLRYYLVELSVDGKPLPLGKNQFPVSTLSKPEYVESFRSKVSSEAGANEGILLPQYLTPFAFDNSRQAPSYIRIETTR